MIFCTVIGNSTERRKIERGREETNEERLYTVHTYLSTSIYTPGAPTTMPVLPSVVSWGYNERDHELPSSQVE